MRVDRVRESLYLLSGIHSLLKVGHDWYLGDNFLESHAEFISAALQKRPADSVVAIYVNGLEILDCLIITNNGIDCIYGTTGRFVPYASMRSVSKPMQGERELDVELSSGEFETISIHGATDEVDDIFEFYEFLMQLIPHNDAYTLLKDVESKQDLLTLMQKTYGHFAARQTKDWIDRLFDNAKDLDINPEALETPSLLRILGLTRIQIEEARKTEAMEID